jgi:arginyl-tRNA synthetase
MSPCRWRFQLARTLRKGAESHRRGVDGGARGHSRRRSGRRGAERLSERFLDRRAFLLPRVRQEIGLEAAAPERPSSNTRRSIPTRRRTSATCATPPSATPSRACLRFRGTPVEVQNYIDDLGVQVADIIVGFRDLEHASSTMCAGSPTRRDSTTTAGTCTRASPSGTSRTRRTSRARNARCTISRRAATTPPRWAFIAERIVRAHLATMARLNIAYDLLTYEGDILRLQFWAHAFEMLKAQGRYSCRPRASWPAAG